LTKLRCF